MNEIPAKSAASFWLEAPERKKPGDSAQSVETRCIVQPGFLIHAHMSAMRPDQKRNFFILDRIRRAPTHVLNGLCAASASRDEAVLCVLRTAAALALAEFFCAIHVLGLTRRDDSLVLLDFLNARALAMAKSGEVASCGVFTDIELLHFEDIWRSLPRAFEEATLAHCLAYGIPRSDFAPLIAACEAGGFLARERVCLSNAVFSTGVMEAVVAECLSERCGDGRA